VSVRALPEPDGGSSNSNMTELQMHVSFFDRNKDGILTPLETFQGVISLLSCAWTVWNYPFFFVHLFLYLGRYTQDLLLSDVKLPSPPRLHRQFILLSLLWPTLYALSPWLYPVRKYLLSEFRTRSASFLPLQPGALPPYINIYVEYIHKAIHGSDTGAYDSKGR